MQITTVALNYIKLYIIMVVIYGYLERENDRVFKFHMNNSSFSEISFDIK